MSTKTTKKATPKPAQAPAAPEGIQVGQVVTYDAPGLYGGQMVGHGLVVALEDTDEGPVARVAAFPDVHAVPVASIQATD